MKTLYKLCLAFFLFSSFWASAQPPNPPGGNGAGGDGTGEQVPVDMYMYWLAFIAIMLILFCSKKYKLRKI
ncbi:signal peptidase [Chryseobacterium shandongense]|jgi:hypothetical protein|uniref:Signal peptidase n=1 Tax=Chryseobacterium shandongense TaxID=1493872 RepID=A0A3G6Q414_9FLAO|nr:MULTISPECIES: hypothetical protein [Chryseobacterium]AZA58775.1 signal peptidase [Chryseobacterium shandongense]AZA86952.1 signal peptidase [Chryseobacterium shandongense]AZA95380.1 signal peptidase [Chryseobacterium shandongense]